MSFNFHFKYINLNGFIQTSGTVVETVNCLKCAHFLAIRLKKQSFKHISVHVVLRYFVFITEQ